MSIEDLIIAGQPKLPVDEFGNSCPNLVPEGFDRNSLRLDLAPRGKKVNYRESVDPKE